MQKAVCLHKDTKENRQTCNDVRGKGDKGESRVLVVVFDDDDNEDYDGDYVDGDDEDDDADGNDALDKQAESA